MRGLIRAVSILAWACGIPLACSDLIADARGICR